VGSDAGVGAAGRESAGLLGPPPPPPPRVRGATLAPPITGLAMHLNKNELAIVYGYR
jgi:hypothetical protein